MRPRGSGARRGGVSCSLRFREARRREPGQPPGAALGGSRSSPWERGHAARCRAALAPRGGLLVQRAYLTSVCSSQSRDVAVKRDSQDPRRWSFSVCWQPNFVVARAVTLSKRELISSQRTLPVEMLAARYCLSETPVEENSEAHVLQGPIHASRSYQKPRTLETKPASKLMSFAQFARLARPQRDYACAQTLLTAICVTKHPVDRFLRAARASLSLSQPLSASLKQQPPRITNKWHRSPSSSRAPRA